MDKYFYLKTKATIGDDDDAAQSLIALTNSFITAS